MDDQPQAAAPRAGRRAQAGRRSVTVDEGGGGQDQESPTGTSGNPGSPDGGGVTGFTPSSARSSAAQNEDAPPPARKAAAGGGGDPPAASPFSRRGQNFVDPSAGDGPPPKAGGGGFMDSSAGGSSSFRKPAGGAPPPDGEQMDEAGGRRAFTGVSRRKQEQAVKVEEEKAVRARRYEDVAADGIMEIPELEEEGKEDLTNVVAEAPKVRTNRVQGISELDEDQQFKLPSTDDRDIDLSVLTAVLCSSDQVEEADEVWEPDMLFTDVASELNREKEKAEGPTGDEGGGDQGNDLLGQMGGDGGGML